MSELVNISPTVQSFGAIEIAQLGDSRTFQADEVTAPFAGSHSARRNMVGYQIWTEILTGGRVSLPQDLNFGVSGDTDEDIYARVAAVVASRAKVVLLHAGVNNWSVPISLEAARAARMATVAALTAAGKLVLQTTDTPRDASGIGSAQSRYDQLAWPEWLAYIGRSTPGVVTVNTFDAFVDPTVSGFSSNYNKAANYRDVAHYPQTGGYSLAKCIADVVNTIFPPRDPLLTSAADVYSATYLPTGNLNSNGMMNGTSGTANGTGTVATGCTVSVNNGDGLTVTTSKITDADGYPAQRIAIVGTPSSSSASVLLDQGSFLDNVVQGEVLQGMCKMAMSPDPGNYFAVEQTISSSGSGLAVGSMVARSNVIAEEKPSVQDGWSGPVILPPYIVPDKTGMTALRHRIAVRLMQNEAVNIQLDVGRMSARKVV